jgi:hypothetical protein
MKNPRIQFMKLIAMDSVPAEGKEIELIQLLHVKALQRLRSQ